MLSGWYGYKQVEDMFWCRTPTLCIACLVPYSTPCVVSYRRSSLERPWGLRLDVSIERARRSH